MVLMDDNSAVILSLGPFALPTMQRSPLHVLKFDPSLVSPTLPLSLSLQDCNPIRPFLKVSLELFLLIGALREERAERRRQARVTVVVLTQYRVLS